MESCLDLKSSNILGHDPVRLYAYKHQLSRYTQKVAVPKNKIFPKYSDFNWITYTIKNYMEFFLPFYYFMDPNSLKSRLNLWQPLTY